ncbi:MAG TPA: flagellar motor protein MotB [Balneolales bacterium]|nr:flagellar motor protein MotB [Balneolales bacterium]
MAEKKDEKPVINIIKKKSGHGGGHHGGAWKVAYADFVTAMMALFIVLWIVGQSKKVKQSVSHYFKDPGAFMKSTGSALSSDGKIPDLTKAGKDSTLTLKLSDITQLREEGKKLKEMISSLPEFKDFKNQVEITITKDGLKIDLIEDSTGVFFDVGSARLKPKAISLLQMMGSDFKKLPNGVIIDGYTDARPYVTQNYSNWMLSVDRANAARKILLKGGMRNGQLLQIRGYADRDLREPKHPYDASNRRVSIVVAMHKSSADSMAGKLGIPPPAEVSTTSE